MEPVVSTVVGIKYNTDEYIKIKFLFPNLKGLPFNKKFTKFAKRQEEIL